MAKKMTNADRIRAMSDDSLFNFIERAIIDDKDFACPFCNMCKDDEGNGDGCLKWRLTSDAYVQLQGLDCFAKKIGKGDFVNLLQTYWILRRYGEVGDIMHNKSRSKFWIGKSFMDWCAADENANDDRKINYTLISHLWNGDIKREVFSSDDKVNYQTMLKIRQSTILDVKLDNNEWYFVIEYYGIV